LAAQRFDGSTVGGTTARRLNGLTVGNQRLDGLTAKRFGGSADRWIDSLTALQLDGLPVDDSTTHQLGGSGVRWLDGSMA
jgi:hypothetical protein